MSGRNTHISLRGDMHSSAQSPSEEFGHATSSQEGRQRYDGGHTGRGPGHARNSLGHNEYVDNRGGRESTKMLKGGARGGFREQGHSVEDLSDPRTLQHFLSAAAALTDSDPNKAQGIVDIVEDGYYRLRTQSQYIEHAKSPENATHDSRIAKYKLMSSQTASTKLKAQAAITVLKLETEAKVLAAKAEHELAQERNEFALAKYERDMDDYQADMDDYQAAREAARATAPPGAAPAAAPAVAPSRSRKRAVVPSTAPAGPAAASPAAAPAGAPAEADAEADEAAERASQAALAAVRAPVRPITNPTGDII
jgi:hypothetical protein